MQRLPYLTISWRNLWRHPIRTVLTILAIMFAVAVLVFFIALQQSSYDQGINTTVSLLTGHIQIQKKGFMDLPEIRKRLPNAKALVDKLVSIPEIEAIGVRATAFALLNSGERTYAAQILGVDPIQERKLSSIPGQVKKGRYFNSISERGLFLGSTIARNLKVDVGDEISLLGQGLDGSVVATALSIVGIFESGSTEIDRSLVQAPLQTIQEEFGLENGAHQIVIKITKLSKLEQIVAEVKAKVIVATENLRVLRWDELQPGLKQAIELDMAGGWLFYFSLILIVSFSVLNTFLMAVLERKRELGIMLALGTHPVRISSLVVLESFFLTVIGVLLGLTLGISIVTYFGFVGFSVPGSEEVMKIWNLPAIVYTELSRRALLEGPLIILVSSLLSIIYPALWIFSIKSVEAINQR